VGAAVVAPAAAAGAAARWEAAHPAVEAEVAVVPCPAAGAAEAAAL